MDNPELEKLKAEAATVKGWFERNLNWLIAAGCLVIGIIIGHVVR